MLVPVLLVLLAAACDPGSKSGNNGNNVNNLPSACGDVGGTPYEYVISDIYVPQSLAEGVGVDYDGNGSIDNKLSSLMSLLLDQSTEFQINDNLDEGIANGTLIVLGRIMAETFSGDPDISVSIFQGTYTGTYTADILSGTGTFTWDSTSPNVGTLCGRVYGAGITQAGPGDITLSLPVNETMTLSLVLHHARVEGVSSPEGWTDMVIAGAVLPADLKNTIIPNYVDNVNADIAADPVGSQFILDTFDDACSTELAGCAGSPECAADGVITETELQCNSIINTILTPDVTIGGVQYVSFGIRVQAVPADITNL
ncbi:MAG: hypothetical protein CVU59_03925 [Deltaproteobacteria bacterium HGW-Deltaproteobacteria-17]|nr:MAG: hypothetical protein CVU59_03925 [Deltaproteobacteria bacterium HGW-Deltaproteobacteria-17]